MSKDELWIRIGKLTKEIRIYEAQVQKLKRDLEELYFLEEHSKEIPKEEE